MGYAGIYFYGFRGQTHGNVAQHRSLERRTYCPNRAALHQLHCLPAPGRNTHGKGEYEEGARITIPAAFIDTLHSALADNRSTLVGQDDEQRTGLSLILGCVNRDLPGILQAYLAGRQLRDETLHDRLGQLFRELNRFAGWYLFTVKDSRSFHRLLSGTEPGEPRLFHSHHPLRLPPLNEDLSIPQGPVQIEVHALGFDHPEASARGLFQISWPGGSTGIVTLVPTESVSAKEVMYETLLYTVIEVREGLMQSGLSPAGVQLEIKGVFQTTEAELNGTKVAKPARAAHLCGQVRGLLSEFRWRLEPNRLPAELAGHIAAIRYKTILAGSLGKGNEEPLYITSQLGGIVRRRCSRSRQSGR